MNEKIRIAPLLVAFLAGLLLLATSVFLDLGRATVYFKERTEAAVPPCAEKEEASQIFGWAGPVSLGHFITDIMEYEVAVFFCPEIEVKEKQLVKAVNLSPFEMVGKPKISYRVGHNGTRKLLTLTYTIQALHIVPGKEYAFPHVPVEYSYRGKENVYWIRDIKPIYIAWIISPDSVAKAMAEGGGVEFQPLKPELASRPTLFAKRWFQIGGGILVALGFAGVLYRLIPRRRVKTLESQDAYRAEVLGTLHGIESQAVTNVRSSMHRLYNLTLELCDNPTVRQKRAAIENIGKEAQDLAYAKDEPIDARQRASTAIENMVDIMGGDT